MKNISQEDILFNKKLADINVLTSLLHQNKYFNNNFLSIKKANHQELPSKRMTFIMEPLPRFELGTLALQVRCSGQLS